MKKYVVIMSVRNEERFIETTINSVIDQTVKPNEFIIVDDGSTDSTPEIIARYVSQFDWIHSLNFTQVKKRTEVGEVVAFYYGLANSVVKDWDYIVKLDGDLAFDKSYFQSIMKKFEGNPKLGIATGWTWTYNPRKKMLVMDKMPGDHTRGPIKMYSREVWNDIGGIKTVSGWDTIDELQAQTLGWETRSFKELVVKHFKPIGFMQKNIFKRETFAGERFHYLGYHPVFVVALGCYKMIQKFPFFICGLLNIFGYLWAIISNSEQIEDRKLIRHLRKKQMERLTFRRPLFG